MLQTTDVLTMVLQVMTTFFPLTVLENSVIETNLTGKRDAIWVSSRCPLCKVQLLIQRWRQVSDIKALLLDNGQYQASLMVFLL